MSAIALPLVHSNTVTNPVVGANSAPVNAEHIMAFGKVVTPAVENSSRTPRFDLVITVLGTANQPRTVTWAYVDEATLDTAYTALLTATSVAI